MFSGVDRILVRVNGLPAAVRHYRDKLGLTLLREDRHLAVLQLLDGKTQLVLHDDPDLPGDATFLLVDDVRQLHQRRGELKWTFVSPPVKVSRGWRATVRDAFGAVYLIIDRTGGGPGVEDAAAPAALFAGVEVRAPVRKALLAAIYKQIGRTADDLPYTPHFESLYEQYVLDQPDPKPERAEVWRHLLTVRKGGTLPKLGDAKSVPPEITPEQADHLRSLLGDDIGKRDRLPYTPRFDEIADAFNRGQRRSISPHHLWRVIAKLAK